MTEPLIRAATRDDVPAIVGLVKELAEFEKAPDEAKGTVASFTACMFPDAPATPTVWGFVAEADGQVVAMAVWFLTFSTWTGTNGIWLEDLYVKPEYRNHGIASALIGRVARVCAERGYPRLEWVCLDWNQNALRLYRQLGAAELEGWRHLRTTGAALTALAGAELGG